MTTSATGTRLTSFAPQLLVSDLERAMAYYARLGFTFGEPWDGFYAIGRREGLELHLKEAHGDEVDRSHRREQAHLDVAAGVDGIEAFYEQCVARGVTILKPLEATAWGTADFYVEDPDGNVVAFGGRPGNAGSDQPVRGFFERYREAFERFDAEAIADLFAYPCQVTSDMGDSAPVTLSSVPSRAACIEQLQRLLAGYRAIGVASARLASLEVNALSPRLCHASVHWELEDRHGHPVYDFHAIYTLVKLDGALRVGGIAHDELPRLRARMARVNEGRPGSR